MVSLERAVRPIIGRSQRPVVKPHLVVEHEIPVSHLLGISMRRAKVRQAGGRTTQQSYRSGMRLVEDCVVHVFRRVSERVRGQSRKERDMIGPSASNYSSKSDQSGVLPVLDRA